MKKYYYDEHETNYRHMKANHILAWDEYYDSDKYSFDHFMMRPFLEKALAQISLNDDEKSAFEYGCGTGAGANFLVQNGFEVDAVDISPTAIAMATEIARERNLGIHYQVQDLLAMPSLGKTYDLILDNYCLQSIVTDKDRGKLFSLVRSGLKANGYYILSTAIFNESRDYGNGESTFFEESTGMVYDKVLDGGEQFEDAVFVNGSYWIPNRRHLHRDKLREELIRAGFDILFQDGGDLICKKSTAGKDSLSLP